MKNFTVSGQLDPNMQNVPQLSVCLLNAPESLPTHKLSAGTGTTHDFNIHIFCREPGAHLPIGSYVFGYEATCDTSVEDAETEII